MANQFDIYRKDLQSLACQRTLEVFRRDPVIRGIQTAQVQEGQDLHDAVIDTLHARTLDGAKGYNLEAIGRIIGLYPRPLVDAGAILYFSPDDALAAPDWSPVYVNGAPVAGQVSIGDVDYLLAIKAKIVKNHTKYGSAPELQYWAKFAYGALISVRNIGLSDLEVVFSASTPPPVVSSLLSEFSDNIADHQYELPVPTTARIRKVHFKYPDAFAPDIDNGAPDVALMGVGYVINS